jgi:hypothetical protein
MEQIDEQNSSSAVYAIALSLLTVASLTFGYFGMQQRVANGWPSTQAKIESVVEENEPQPTE